MRKSSIFRKLHTESCGRKKGTGAKTGIHKRPERRSAAGFTLAEMLVTIVVILLVTATLTVAVSLAVRQYNKSMRNSEALILSSTLKNIITHELQYTGEIRGEEIEETGEIRVTEFLSPTYAIKDSLSNFYAVTGNEADLRIVDGYGRIFCGTADGTEGSLVLADASYQRGLGAKVESITYDEESNYFTVVLKIGFQDTVYADETFMVLNLNKVTAS